MFALAGIQYLVLFIVQLEPRIYSLLFLIIIFALADDKYFIIFSIEE